METEKIIEVNGKKYKILFPNVEQGQESDMAYAKAFNSSLKNGIVPRATMDFYIRDNGIWPQENETRIAELTDKIKDTLIALKTEKDNDKRDELRFNFVNQRNEILLLNSQKQALYNNTAEAKGEEAKISSLVWKCVQNEDGKRVWETEKDFLNERDIELVSSLLEKFVMFTSGLENRMNEIDSILENPIVEDQDIKEELQNILTEEPVLETSVQE